MSETLESKPPEIVMGECYGGPCDGQEFQHTADMQRVRIRDRGKPAGLHIYEHHEELSTKRGKPMFLWEKTDKWRVG